MRITVAILGLARIIVASSSGQGHINPSKSGHGKSEPITFEEMPKILHELQIIEAAAEAFQLYQKLWSLFGESHTQERERLGHALRQLMDQTRFKILKAKVAGIRERFGGLFFKGEDDIILRSIADKDEVEDEWITSEEFNNLNPVLDSIYAENPQYPEVTRPELETAQIFKPLVDEFDTLSEDKRKRIKGWLIFMNRYE